MSVLSPPWPSQPPGHSAASFSALAAPVVPPLHPSDSPFPSPTHGHSPFSALAGPHSSHPQMSRHQSPVPGPSALGGVPQRNARSLDRDALVQILDFFSTLLPVRLGHRFEIRLVIHGGAVMLLNRELAQLAADTAATDGRATQRTTTRDIDYIARSFASEWAQRYGVYDANDRLKQCIYETALQFGLGADWMNSDADVALPMATDPATGAVYDPIHAASIQMGDALTVYTSPNGILKLVSVTPFWTVALKMVRYNPVDRSDICILLRSGTRARQLHWTPARLELWLLGTCWAMGYAGYDHERIKQMRTRMIEVVAEANRWDPHAVADDGRGGVVPLRAPADGYPGAGYAYGHGYYGYAQQPGNFHHGAVGRGGGDPRMGTPFRSSPGHSPQVQTFPPSHPPSPIYASRPPTPFYLGSAPTPPPKKQKTSKTKTNQKAVTTWPNSWTTLPPQERQQQQWDWDPESAERWDQDVRQAAAKEKKHGRMTSWIPFLKGSKSQPALKTAKPKRFSRREYDDSDSDSEDSYGSSGDESDSDDDDEWLERQRQRWGTTGRDRSRDNFDYNAGVGPGAGARGGFQHNVADFMSNGMAHVAAPAVMASGHAHGAVLPGWNVPGTQSMQAMAMSPRPQAYAHRRSQTPADMRMNQVAAEINALGLYGV
ncbi:hypothetical protein C8R47DRAFT_211653 [Mycena vitilis]|nr:hypothetical protein C8R47DRAFT_211653 [Mycena vitilis]